MIVLWKSRGRQTPLKRCPLRGFRIRQLYIWKTLGLASRQLANRPLRVFELRPPGFLSRFAILPPVSRIDAIIGKHDEISSARLTGGMTVEIVPFEGDISTRSGVHAAMSYVAIRAMAEAEGVAKQLIGDQSRKLAQFASGAIPAEVGASADPFCCGFGSILLDPDAKLRAPRDITPKLLHECYPTAGRGTGLSLATHDRS